MPNTRPPAAEPRYRVVPYVALGLGVELRYSRRCGGPWRASSWRRCVGRNAPGPWRRLIHCRGLAKSWAAKGVPLVVMPT